MLKGRMALSYHMRLQIVLENVRELVFVTKASVFVPRVTVELIAKTNGVLQVVMKQQEKANVIV